MTDHISEEDIPYEEDLQRLHLDPEAWLRYLDHLHRSNSPLESIWLVYERAVLALPWSYKLWKAYLDERAEKSLEGLTQGTTSLDEIGRVNWVYERALACLPRMPRLWVDYTQFLMRQRKINLTRRVIGRALQALPVSQHGRVWELALKLAAAVETRSPKTATSLWARHWQIAEHRRWYQEYLDMLMRVKDYDRAAVVLLQLADSSPSEQEDEDGSFTSGAFWDRLCSLLMAHGEHVQSVDPEWHLRLAIASATQTSAYQSLSHGGQRPTTAAGVLWCAIALLQIRQRKLNAARSIYEEALGAVPTVRDFCLVFDAYARFEETLLAAEMEKARRKALLETPVTEATDTSGKKKKGTAKRGTKKIEGPPKEDDEALKELDVKLARLENLYERRPFLLQEIRLAQQPNNVAEWQRFIALIAIKEDPEATVAAYERALTTINGKKAKGDLPGLWDGFARFFEELAARLGDPVGLESSIDIHERAVTEGGDWPTPDDHARMWIAYAEFLRRHPSGEFEGLPLDAALDLLGRAGAPAAGKVSKSPLLWSYILDLEEARGAHGAILAAYEHVLKLGIATLQTIINYAEYLLAHQPPLLDQAFRVYERGIAMFGWPMAFDLWNVYLPKAVSTWGPAGHIERIRDIFEQALAGCPPHMAKPFYLAAAAAEEQWGMSARPALKMLQRAASAVTDPEDKLELYQLLVAKTSAVSGIVATRPVYESALTDTALPYASLTALACEYASMESRLGEFERARAIYAHVASLGDPRTVPSLWTAWSDFEVAHGDEASYREMLRIKRAAQSKFQIVVASFVPAATSGVYLAEEEAPIVAVNEEEIQLDI